MANANMFPFSKIFRTDEAVIKKSKKFGTSVLENFVIKPRAYCIIFFKICLIVFLKCIIKTELRLNLFPKKNAIFSHPDKNSRNVTILVQIFGKLATF